jgi:hypothetical protein
MGSARPRASSVETSCRVSMHTEMPSPPKSLGWPSRTRTPFSSGSGLAIGGVSEGGLWLSPASAPHAQTVRSGRSQAGRESAVMRS